MGRTKQVIYTGDKCMQQEILIGVEDQIIEKMGSFRINKQQCNSGIIYRYESDKRVKLDETKSIGSLLTYSVYGNTRLEAANKLLQAITKDEEEFNRLREYYSMKNKDCEQVVSQKFGDYCLTITRGKDNE